MRFFYFLINFQFIIQQPLPNDSHSIMVFLIFPYFPSEDPFFLMCILRVNFKASKLKMIHVAANIPGQKQIKCPLHFLLSQPFYLKDPKLLVKISFLIGLNCVVKI